MAFAQYYYDPALEFERLLDDHGAQAVPGLPVPSPESGSVVAQRTVSGQDRVAYVLNRFVINDVVLTHDGVACNHLPGQVLHRVQWGSLSCHCCSDGPLGDRLDPDCPFRDT